MDNYSQVVKTAQDYYNSDDADNFYFHIWGGEDIHIGMYSDAIRKIDEASQRTVDTMARLLDPIAPGSRIIDLGAGYGGAARYLCKSFDCSVHCINLSETQNDRNRELTKAQGLQDSVIVTDASFEDLPVEDAQYDVVWSQDSFLHSGDRQKVMREIDRVLRPGGKIIFTDPMQADDCPEGVLQPVYDRIHLDSLGSPGFYHQQAELLGWQNAHYEEMTFQLVQHYQRVREELQSRRSELLQHVSADYVDRMLAGLQHWIDAGSKDYLSWGILRFQKPGH